MLETAKEMPAWLGATSAWFDMCPEELQAERPMDREMRLTKRRRFGLGLVPLCKASHRRCHIVNLCENLLQLTRCRLLESY